MIKKQRERWGLWEQMVVKVMEPYVKKDRRTADERGMEQVEVMVGVRGCERVVTITQVRGSRWESDSYRSSWAGVRGMVGDVG